MSSRCTAFLSEDTKDVLTELSRNRSRQYTAGSEMHGNLGMVNTTSTTISGLSAGAKAAKIPHNYLGSVSRVSDVPVLPAIL